MRKNLLKNNGFPKAVDQTKDLVRIEWSSSDSWYLKCEFKSGDIQLGFTWHQMIHLMPDGTYMNSLESVFMNATDNKWIHKNIMLPLSETAGADTDKFNVYTPYGGICGDHTGMDLKFEFEDQKIDIHCIPSGEIEHQGVTGLLDFGSMQSYEYGFVNMKVEGTVTIDDTLYEITIGHAWFDRQYGHINKKNEPPKFLPGKASWLWLGIDNLKGGRGAASFGDIYNPGERMCFATFLHEDGTEANVEADIIYDNIWTSKKTGFAYPRTIGIDVLEEDFYVTLTSLGTEDVEFVIEGENKGLSGCQCLFQVVGTYKGSPINQVCIVETIGDLCGED